jgi:hypothetical protein
MKIKLNGQEIEVNKSRLTYEEIVAMVYQASVVFTRGSKSKPEGILHTGQSVKVADGMHIDCIVTGAA